MDEYISFTDFAEYKDMINSLSNITNKIIIEKETIINEIYENNFLQIVY